MRVINFDRGSKRRMHQIRWRPLEIISLVLLTIITMTITLFAVLWEISHDAAEPEAPHLQDRR